MSRRNLGYGDTGDDVKEVQTFLNDAGFPVNAVDGIFGPSTTAAVKSFQRDRGLVDDGVVGPKTYAALLFAQPKPAPVPGSNPTPITVRPDPKFKTLQEIDANFEKGTTSWYQNAFLIMQDDPGFSASIDSAARIVLKHKDDLYLPVEQKRGVPWAMVAIIHSMECGNSIYGCLHNGESIIGTSRKTTLVPKGRGPFNKFQTLQENWIDAALDAIDIQSLWSVPRWSIGYILKQVEAFNGTGYLRYHHQENSPYLWARTNINDGTGKYVSDGHWDENANANAQTGAAAILSRLEAWGDFKVQYD